MTEVTTKYFEKWRIKVVDKMTGEIMDGKYYVVEDMAHVKEVIKEIIARLEKLGVKEDSILVETQFIKYILKN